MNKKVKYVAELNHVREVTLRGVADRGYWTRRLASEGLTPADDNGRARISIMAANMKFRGVRFTEISFSIDVVMPDPRAWSDAAFLVHAFTTSRLFAFCERKFFRTPYYRGECQVSTSPVAIRLGRQDQPVFLAEMRLTSSMPDRTFTNSGPASWEGPIFLPTPEGAKKSRVFFGKLHGTTSSYPFLGGTDSLSIVSQASAAIFQDLIDSGFAGEEWIVREDANHARSKTYPRSFLTDG